MNSLIACKHIERKVCNTYWFLLCYQLVVSIIIKCYVCMNTQRIPFQFLHVAIFILYPVSYFAYFCKFIRIYHLLSLRRFAANIYPHVFSDWYSDKSSMHIKLKNICTDYDNSEKSDYEWHFVYIANDQKLYFYGLKTINQQTSPSLIH